MQVSNQDIQSISHHRVPLCANYFPKCYNEWNGISPALKSKINTIKGHLDVRLEELNRGRQRKALIQFVQLTLGTGSMSVIEPNSGPLTGHEAKSIY